jgi:hypothetical protein
MCSLLTEIGTIPAYLFKRRCRILKLSNPCVVRTGRLGGDPCHHRRPPASPASRPPSPPPSLRWRRPAAGTQKGFPQQLPSPSPFLSTSLPPPHFELLAARAAAGELGDSDPRSLSTDPATPGPDLARGRLSGRAGGRGSGGSRRGSGSAGASGRGVWRPRQLAGARCAEVEAAPLNSVLLVSKCRRRPRRSRRSWRSWPRRRRRACALTWGSWPRRWRV